ncbi:MAG: hypothetical protein GC182_05405 [Rhodopseudomonas sp.]|nr:hypothetical protein [Rhodopseudomonas sp.]
MKKKTLVIGGIAAATLFIGGWAFAQSGGHGPAGFRPGYMHGRGFGGIGQGGMGSGHMGPGGMSGMRGQMGPAMQGQMQSQMDGMRGRMGGGMMAMMGGNATMDERSDIHGLLFNHASIKRSVTNLPDGIRTVTESEDPQVAATIKKHVADMGKRVDEGRDPGLPIESPALHSIFRDNDKIKTTYETTDKGVVVTQTSADAGAVKALQDHAAEVTDLAQRGMIAEQEAMMKNGGMMGRGMMAGVMMGRGMHGAMAEQ